MHQMNLFNDGWKFYKGDAGGAEAAAFDDREWRAVTLPHDWSIEGPFDPRWASGTGFLPGGIGWYRKTFTLPEAPAAFETFVHFEGVYCNSEVWLNGHFLGRRPSGFASFRYDLTPFLRQDAENTLAVKVDHSQFADARWYTGSGIYRNVFLGVASPVCIKQGGVFVTTPTVTADAAEISVEVTLRNSTDTPASALVALVLRDAADHIAAETTLPVVVPPGGEQCGRGLLAVRCPRLWSVDNPELYTLRAEVRQGDAVVDREDTAVGIRTFRFDAEEGFFLNEQNMKLKGVCLHDDAGALGTAVPVKVWERRLRTLKAAGVNAIRMAHNPHLPALYDLCDRLGFLVQDEAFDEWELGKRKWSQGWNVGTAGTDGPHAHFADWGEADLRDMILQNRNHPCVIMWSIGNEIDYPNDPYTHEVLDTGRNPQIYGRGFQPSFPHSDRLGVVARRLAAVARICDPTRPITAALSAASVSNETGFADALDIVGYNYQEGRYQDDHARCPRRVLYGSENGMRWDFWASVADNSFIAGQFLWTGIDYLGEAKQWPFHGSGAGLLDLAGLPKPEYHFRRSLWTTAPMIYLGVSAVPDGGEAVTLWTHKSADPVWSAGPGGMRRVSGFTNCARAELFVNGRSLGSKAPQEDGGHVAWWDIPYEAGTLTIHGLGQESPDAAATDSLTTSGPAAKIVAEADAYALAADGLDVAHVLVSIVDEHGTVVYDAGDEITWTVTGPARLLGLENGDLADSLAYQAGARHVFQGRLLGYVQATSLPGTITLTLTAPGLSPANVTMQAK